MKDIRTFQEVVAALKHIQWERLIIGNNIMAGPFVTARTYMRIPHDEKVFALWDSTPFSWGKAGLVVAKGGIYTRLFSWGWGGWPLLVPALYKRRFWSWSEIKSINLAYPESNGDLCLQINDGTYWSVFLPKDEDPLIAGLNSLVSGK